MINPQYVRAEFDEDRDSYVSTEADWDEGESSLEYRFTLQEDEEQPDSWEGGLEKLWRDEERDQYGEVFVFAKYDSEGAFDADVVRIRQEAKERSVRDNLDEFLVVTDIVKERAQPLRGEDDAFDDFVGLFEDGPEDAYSLREWDDSPRLHNHVESADECWYLHVGKVIDPNQQLLGWGLFAVHLPDLTSDAPTDAVRNASRARVLLIDHLKSQRDSKLAKRGFTYFMETERLDNPEYAHTDDTEILENMAIESEWDDATNSVIWKEYSGQALQEFLSGSAPFVYPREKWQPREESMADRFFKEHPQPIWLEDQLRAALDEQTSVEPDEDEDEDSPWQNLDLD